MIDNVRCGMERGVWLEKKDVFSSFQPKALGEVRVEVRDLPLDEI